MSQILNRRSKRRQDNLLQLQMAFNNGWVNYTLDEKIEVVSFREKGKIEVDFILLKNKFIVIATGEIFRLNMKQFLKWYRRNSNKEYLINMSEEK